MNDKSLEESEDFDSIQLNQNKSQTIELNNMENQELENLQEDQQLFDAQISNEQNDNQIKKLILNINLILTISYIVQIIFGIGVFLALIFTISFEYCYQINTNELRCEQNYSKLCLTSSIIIGFIFLIILLFMIVVRFKKNFWKYQIQLVIYVTILFIIFNASIWYLIYNQYDYCWQQYQDNIQYQYQGEIYNDESDQLAFLEGLKISLSHLYFYFNFHLGIILLQTHITYQMSANKKIILIFKNFIVSILCGCSVIFFPSYTIILYSYKGIFYDSDFVDQNPWQWRWEGFLINPIVFSIYTFLYIQSVKQIQNGKFQLRDDQKYIGALLTFINMFT